MPVITPNRFIRGITPSLQWLADLLAFFQVETIRIPTRYREKVIAVKRVLEDDASGLATSLLDFAISAALVDYTIETDIPALSEKLNGWLDDINADNRGMVPTGLNALAKEYFRERWKGSSNLLLRTFWTEKDGLILPTTMFFVDGEDIKVEPGHDDGVLRLGDEKYYIRTGDNLSGSNTITKKDIPLPTDDNEVLFSQKPFESWGTLYPTPYLIKRGIFRNVKFAAIMSQKGEFIVGRALEYMLIVKKGTERMALEGNVTYDKDDLKNANEDLKEILARKKNEPGFPSYVTNFDTDVSEYIPDYKKAISQELYGAIETRILSGLGFVDVVSSVKAGARREGLLNPKPFFSEVEQGIKDFKALLNDIVATIIEKNAKSHKKWMNSDIQIISSPIKESLDNDTKTLMRSLYDRGLLSKETAISVLGESDISLETLRREKESDKGLDDKLEPPIIQNQGPTELNPSPKKKVLPDRTGPEAKNFKMANLEDYDSYIDQIEGEEYLVTAKEFEEAPYKNTESLPASVKVLPPGGQSLWRRVFNNAYPKGEDYARKVAWSVVKEHYKRDKNGKWTTKSKGSEEIETASVVDETIKQKQLELLEKRIKIADKLLKEQ